LLTDDIKEVLHHFGIVPIMIRLTSISRRTLNSRSPVTGTEHVHSYPRNSIECEVGDLILIDSSMNHHKFCILLDLLKYFRILQFI